MQVDTLSVLEGDCPLKADANGLKIVGLPWSRPTYNPKRKVTIMDSQQAAHMINLLREIAVELRITNDLATSDREMSSADHTTVQQQRNKRREALK